MSSQFSLRRESRGVALQFLYAWSINKPTNITEDIRLFFEGQEKDRDQYAFAEELIHGVLSHVDEIDGHIRTLAHNWEFDRIARIDLAILRLAIFEMLFRKDIPPVVSINEAIDLSKNFSTADSKRFINGILDRMKDKVGRDARKPTTE